MDKILDIFSAKQEPFPESNFVQKIKDLASFFIIFSLGFIYAIGSVYFIDSLSIKREFKTAILSFVSISIFVGIYFILRRRFKSKKKPANVTRIVHSYTSGLFDKKIKELKDMNVGDHEKYFKIFYESCLDSSNILASILTDITGNKICVHLKHFPNTSYNRNLSTDGVMKMLCMSDNNPDSRKKFTLYHKVSDNTHIEKALNSDSGYFYSPNFINHVKSYNQKHKESYKISAKNWAENYKTILIVPVRKKINDTSGNLDFINLGLVYCDSQKINAIGRKNFEIVLDIVKMFSNALYYYFEQYSEILSNLESNSVKLNNRLSLEDRSILLSSMFTEESYKNYSDYISKPKEYKSAAAG